jgi:hypothetical protein
MALITIFTAPKPFTDPHIATIQRNAIRSWLALRPEVDVLLIGEEKGMAEAAAELGVRQLPEVERNAMGTPLVSSMFELARRNSTSPLLSCVNADVMLLPDFIQAARMVREQAQRFLIVGQRWDLKVTEELDFRTGWDKDLRNRLTSQGRLHKATGSDYFIFPRECFTDMPRFAIGRAGWDNWMIYAGRVHGWLVVDASQAITVIHQDHDYSHLPGGQPHYRLPETGENVRLAGGRMAIFELRDASHNLVDGRLKRKPLSWRRLWREVEIFPLVRLNSSILGKIFYAIFHPIKAYRDIRRGGEGAQRAADFENAQVSKDG